jgi:hypothetical protein
MTKMFSITAVYGLLMVSAAYAQSGQPIQAKVPFAFRAQNATLAAGTYRLMYSTSDRTLMIQGLGPNSKAAFATAVPTTGPSSLGRSGKLVFQCDEKICYLAQVWQGSIGNGRGLQVPHPQPKRKVAFAARVVTITVPAK